jgi:hypothetical protein
MAAIPEGMEPPIISMKLDNVNGDLRKGDTDKNGIPCMSHGADKVSCHQLKDTPHQTHYAFCYVDNADETNCPEPTVEAYDHHDGHLEVCAEGQEKGCLKKQVRLFVANNPHEGPHILDNDVTCTSANPTNCGIDYKQRGEYTLIYDAQDHSGNKADTVIFHVFMRDTSAPTITTPNTHTEHTYQKLFELPALRATDSYDGDVTDTLKIKVHTPGGAGREYNYLEKIMINTEVHGKYHLQITAHDFAGAFGKEFKDNYVTKQGYVLVRSKSVTVHYNDEEIQFTPAEAPTPAPAHHQIEEEHHHLSIPPILILKDANGSVITRSSPFGSHSTETKYREHLDHMGYSANEIANHINEIVQREMRMAEMLGEDHAWNFDDTQSEGSKVTSPYANGGTA